MDYPTNRADAKRTGAKYYFTGEPCKHGHVALRKTKGNCVDCVKQESKNTYPKRKEYYEAYAKSEAGKKAKREWYERNKEWVIEKALSRPEEDKQKYRKTWADNNKEVLRTHCNVRRRRYREQSPKWLTKEHKKQMRMFHEQAIALKKATGTQYAVDHIYPLTSTVISGLHVPWNMQVMTQLDNITKFNKLPPDWLGVAFPENIPGGESCIRKMKLRVLSAYRLRV